MFYPCSQVNLAIYYLIDDSPIVKTIFIDKSGLNLLFIVWLFVFRYRKILITKYLLSYLNCLALF